MLLETLSCLSYFDYLNTNELWHRFRSAYRARHPTETTLLRVLNHFLTAGDDGRVSLLNLLDLSAAFDILTMTSSSIGSKMFSAYRILLFLSSDPILLTFCLEFNGQTHKKDLIKKINTCLIILTKIKFGHGFNLLIVLVTSLKPLYLES